MSREYQEQYILPQDFISNASGLDSRELNYLLFSNEYWERLRHQAERNSILVMPCYEDDIEMGSDADLSLQGSKILNTLRDKGNIDVEGGTERNSQTIATVNCSKGVYSAKNPQGYKNLLIPYFPDGAHLILIEVDLENNIITAIDPMGSHEVAGMADRACNKFIREIGSRFGKREFTKKYNSTKQQSKDSQGTVGCGYYTAYNLEQRILHGKDYYERIQESQPDLPLRRGLLSHMDHDNPLTDGLIKLQCKRDQGQLTAQRFTELESNETNFITEFKNQLRSLRQGRNRARTSQLGVATSAAAKDEEERRGMSQVESDAAMAYDLQQREFAPSSRHQFNRRTITYPGESNMNIVRGGMAREIDISGVKVHIDMDYQYQDLEITRLLGQIHVPEDADIFLCTKPFSEHQYQETLEASIDKKILLFPFYSTGHWQLVAVEFINDEKTKCNVILIDSLPNKQRAKVQLYTDIKPIVESMMGQGAVENVFYNTPLLQKATASVAGTVDCGVYVVQNALNIVKDGLYPAIQKKNIGFLHKDIDRQSSKFRADQALLLATSHNASDFEGVQNFVGLQRQITEKFIKQLAFERQDINECDEFGKTLLHHAVEYLHLAMVQSFLDKGGDKNIADDSGKAALHYAARNGSLSALPSLVTAENIDMKDNAGNTALHYAAKAGDLAAVTILVEKGADVTEVNKKQETPLHIAARFGKEYIVLYLCGNEANIMAEDIEGNTALHKAAQQSHKNIVELLLKRGANIYQTNKAGQTANDLAQGATLGYLIALRNSISQEGGNNVTPSLISEPDVLNPEARGERAAVISTNSSASGGSPSSAMATLEDDNVTQPVTQAPSQDLASDSPDPRSENVVIDEKTQSYVSQKLENSKRFSAETKKTQYSKLHLSEQEFNKSIESESSIPLEVKNISELKGKDLWYGDFAKVKFVGDVVSGTSLFMSSFRNCEFENVDLSSSKDLSRVSFNNCKFIGNVQFPENYKFSRENVRHLQVDSTLEMKGDWKQKLDEAIAKYSNKRASRSSSEPVGSRSR